MTPFCSFLLLWGLSWATTTTAFVPTPSIHRQPLTATAAVTKPFGVLSHAVTVRLYASKDDEEEEEKPVNPYADPNYPDLEFVNYDDPEYQVDQGTDEFLTAGQQKDTTEEEIEAMREDRRLRNDEFQFQTYFQKTLSEGADHLCDWTVYQTSTFHPETDSTATGGIPKLIPMGKEPLKVKARATKRDAATLVDERIIHEEIIQPDISLEGNGKKQKDDNAFSVDAYYNSYWPDELSPFDFRGHQGTMVCGNAWTICTAKPISPSTEKESAHKGPFHEYRAEVGIQYESMRYRIKLDYSTLEPKETAGPEHPLHLKYLTVCREVVAAEDGSSVWPRAIEDAGIAEALFGKPGADGGLYDPPPVGDHQTDQYMKLDLPGRATILMPYKMGQERQDEGWVTSLDWSPGVMRFQADRKVGGGSELLGLRSLELTEVQSADADEWRPKDGGEDMRQ